MTLGKSLIWIKLIWDSAFSGRYRFGQFLGPTFDFECPVRPDDDYLFILFFLSSSFSRFIQTYSLRYFTTERRLASNLNIFTAEVTWAEKKVTGVIWFRLLNFLKFILCRQRLYFLLEKIYFQRCSLFPAESAIIIIIFFFNLNNVAFGIFIILKFHFPFPPAPPGVHPFHLCLLFLLTSTVFGSVKK